MQAVEDQISHFGQTPAQLFRRPHPRRGPPPPPTANPLLHSPELKVTPLASSQSRRCISPRAFLPSLP